MCDSAIVTLESKSALAERMAQLARQLAVPLSVDQVLDGALQPLLDSCVEADLATRLAALED